MKKSTLIFFLIISSFFKVYAQNCSDLFISEYVEGSYNNKAIELYNPTSEIIDLSNYSLSRYANGSFIPSTTQLGGVIQPYSTYVIVVDKRDPNGTGYNIAIWNGYWNPLDELNNDIEYDVTEDLQSLADTFINPNFEINTMYFNGNDAVTLEKSNGEIIDVFGKIGENPGEAWVDQNGAPWTKDLTLVRKANVTGGFLYNPAQQYTFDPTLEWDSLPINTFTNLGFHDCNCNLSNPNGGCTDEIACNYNNEANFNDGSCLYPEEGYNCNGYLLEACPYDIYLEYDVNAESFNIDLCQTLIVYGCTDAIAENYNSAANIEMVLVNTLLVALIQVQIIIMLTQLKMMEVVFIMVV